MFRNRLFLLATLLLLCQSVGLAQSTQSPQPLILDQPIEHEMLASEIQLYQIELTAGQYLQLAVEQQGIDLLLAISSADGKQLFELDSREGTAGSETLAFIAETGGLYRLQLRAKNRQADNGRYRLRVELLRAAQPVDQSRLRAQTVWLAAQQLRSQGTAEALRQAIDRLNEARAIWQTLGDQVAEAQTIHAIGGLYYLLSEQPRALDLFQQALPLRRAGGDRQGEATTLRALGSVYNGLSDLKKAQDYFLQALPLFEQVGGRRGQAATLLNLGLNYSLLGENERAMEYYLRARPLFHSAGERRGEAYFYNNLGALYAQLGEKQQALNAYTDGLVVMREIGDHRIEAYTLVGIGEIYAEVADHQRALDYFQQALTLSRSVGDQQDQAYALADLGRVNAQLGNYQEALDYYQQAVKINREIGDREGEAYTLIHLGEGWQALNNRDEAIKQFQSALTIFHELNNPRYQAEALNHLAATYHEGGNDNLALDCYQRALPLTQAVADHEGEAATLAGLAQISRDNGDLKTARNQIEAAIGIIESLRSKIARQELRASYFAAKQSHYQFYIDLLMRLHQRFPRAGYDAEALHASEQARARSLLELLAESHINIRQGVSPQLVKREQSLQQRLTDKQQRLVKLKSAADNQTAITELEKEIAALVSESEQVEAEIRSKCPCYAALKYPKPLLAREIQQYVVTPDTILLEYSLGVEHSYLWLVTTDSISSYQLPGRAEIETAARQVYQLLASRASLDRGQLADNRGAVIETSDQQLLPAITALSQLLLAPVADRLGQKRLLIVADGALLYIPFGALPVPRKGRMPETYQPLLVAHEIINLPSATALTVLRGELRGRDHAENPIVILADPVFSRKDQRVSVNAPQLPATNQADLTTSQMISFNRAANLTANLTAGVDADGLTFARLPGTRREAEQICALLPKQQPEQMLALDFAANRARVTDGNLNQYQIVHFATHGFINTARPELSGIALSLVDREGREQNGLLLLSDLFNLDLSADLVVLSACQTGLGKEIKGEGLIGLTRGFMYAGAATITVSLWSVSDEATAELMTKFYQRMLGQPAMRPAAALRNAQLDLWRSQRWPSPYYWAAFVINGEWR